MRTDLIRRSMVVVAATLLFGGLAGCGNDDGEGVRELNSCETGSSGGSGSEASASPTEGAEASASGSGSGSGSEDCPSNTGSASE